MATWKCKGWMVAVTLMMWTMQMVASRAHSFNTHKVNKPAHYRLHTADGESCIVIHTSVLEQEFTTMTAYALVVLFPHVLVTMIAAMCLLLTMCLIGEQVDNDVWLYHD